MYNTLPSVTNSRDSKGLESYPQAEPQPVDNSGPVRFSDWLKVNGHADDGLKLDECSLRVEHWTCDNGHDFYFRKYCGREYCPTCGAKGSYYHMRRVLRAAEHFVWPVTWGNLTMTMPREISEGRPGKAQLRRLQNLAWEVARDAFDLEGGEVVVHLIGRQDQGLHVHFEVLFHRFGCFNKGKVEPEKIANIKKAWAQKLNEEYDLKLETTDIHYSFAATHPRKWHKLMYIHRPICTEEAMLALSDQDKEYVLSLKGYQRQRWYGEMCNSKLHKFLRKRFAPIRIRERSMLERRVCPICQIKLRYKECLFIDEIPKTQVVQHSGDVWIDRAVDAFLRQEIQGET